MIFLLFVEFVGAFCAVEWGGMVWAFGWECNSKIHGFAAFLFFHVGACLLCMLSQRRFARGLLQSPFFFALIGGQVCFGLFVGRARRRTGCFSNARGDTRGACSNYDPATAVLHERFSLFGFWTLPLPKAKFCQPLKRLPNLENVIFTRYFCCTHRLILSL